MTYVSVRVEGLNELEASLKQWPVEVERDVLSYALRKAMRPIQAAMRRRVPVRTGNLRRGIIIRAGRARKWERKILLGLRLQTTTGGRTRSAWYGKLLEQGWIFRKGATIKVMPGKHYMRSAWLAGRDQVSEEFRKAARERLPRTVARVANKRYERLRGIA